MARLRRRAILLPWRHRMSIDSSGKTAKPKLTITIESFHAHRSGTLYGFATVVIPELHLRIVDCPVHEKNGQRWAGLPAKPQVSKDGSMRRDERGKIMYATVLDFTDRATRDAFSTRVIAALLARFPRVFDEAAA
jgi:hypothetical protein